MSEYVSLPIGARVRVIESLAAPGAKGLGTVVSKVYRNGSGQPVQNVRWDSDGVATRWHPILLCRVENA